ncbi:hypothetical protein FVE85_5466 [Porphyridium purpureum]|uniref:CCT domain-containing protein n=1 Tax=Porphyridium purpureum TaxID=35688 RepID=A0A5J4Z200_PORPP|nr:hypothetical protein FVE85_5466 [Porphyridium purpureum]|eukprot:POR6839..scf295_1
METMWEMDGYEEVGAASAPVGIMGAHPDSGEKMAGAFPREQEGGLEDEEDFIFGFSPVSECALTDYMSRLEEMVEGDMTTVQHEAGWEPSAPIDVKERAEEESSANADAIYGGASLLSDATCTPTGFSSSPMSECGLTTVMSRAHLNEVTSDSHPFRAARKEGQAMPVSAELHSFPAPDSVSGEHALLPTRERGAVSSVCSTVSTVGSPAGSASKKVKSSSTSTGRKRSDGNNHSGVGGKYEYRKKMALSRPRVNGRFIKIADKAAVLEAMELKQ